MGKIRYHHISFKNAFEGIRWAFATQPNFKIHFFLSILALTAGYLFQISFIEFSLLILAIIFGLGAEMINTALEAMTDLITSEYHQQAKIAKDVAAGMMLIVALGAISIAGMIFIPKLLFLL